MSSLEIAELTGKRHDHVMRDIRNMLDELGITHPTFGGSYKDSTGRTLPSFNLPRDLTITLVTGYSIPMRHAVVTRWAELEQAKPALPNFANPAEAARAWASEYEQKQIAQAEVARLAPVAAVGALVCSHEHTLIRYVQAGLPKGVHKVGYLVPQSGARGSACPNQTPYLWQISQAICMQRRRCGHN